ncbi:hypothetical protein CVIRNUC_002532 [Coccomyxa viridis]|uniref:Uncharacterized protein n=1 Tax=Coccomyxa viridis TaxID=1274662 RepID=A0AAV1HZP0_9CHLO|nr:hypothetical protein CVIRNUC_002532 [Coccomyxa viridis]
MAVVPFRVSGAAADQTLEQRLFQIGPHTIFIKQNPKGSGAHHNQARCTSDDLASVELEGRVGAPLGNVGLVVWQSAFVLADYLVARPPYGTWQGVSVIDLGTGTGVVGIGLAMAGARVTLTDLPHIMPLTAQNLALNADKQSLDAQVMPYAWGEDAGRLPQAPDVITGADVVYEQEHFPALISSLRMLAAPHTVIFLSYRLRGRGEEVFEGMLEAKGLFAVHVPNSMLHEEYREEAYKVLRICRL